MTHFAVYGLGLALCCAMYLAWVDEAEAQRRSVAIEVDQNGRAISVRNIARDSTTVECARGTGSGRVTSVERDRNGLISGFRYEDDRFGGSFVNVHTGYLPASPNDRRLIDTRLRDILMVGTSARFVIYGCGAAGRVEVLDAATLISGSSQPRARAEASARPRTDGSSGPLTPDVPRAGIATGQPTTLARPSGPAADQSDTALLRAAPEGSALAPGATADSRPPSQAATNAPGLDRVVPPVEARSASAQPPPPENPAPIRYAEWRFSAVRQVATVTITTPDRRASLFVSCNAGEKPPAQMSIYISPPRRWRPETGSLRLLVNGAQVAVEFDGADDLLSLSDSMAPGGARTAVSRALLDRLADASDVRIAAVDRRGREVGFSFSIRNGREAFTRFDRHCAMKRL